MFKARIQVGEGDVIVFPQVDADSLKRADRCRTATSRPEPFSGFSWRGCSRLPAGSDH
jgi:hypothetical protein